MKRNIVSIDEEKCDGCGLCVTACAEGAIRIIDGKAKLVSDTYCDGLGACLGECPQGAITIEEREADEFDPKAVEEHLAKQNPEKTTSKEKLPCGCPGSSVRTLKPAERDSTATTEERHSFSTLSNWPVQIKLVPVQGPYFEGKKLLIAADCVPFSFADFHERFLRGKTLLVGCPKLDDAQFYLDKLSQIFAINDIKDIEVLYMEVPCCFGMVKIVEKALEKIDKSIPVEYTKISIGGDIISTE